MVSWGAMPPEKEPLFKNKNGVLSKEKHPVSHKMQQCRWVRVVTSFQPLRGCLHLSWKWGHKSSLVDLPTPD